MRSFELERPQAGGTDARNATCWLASADRERSISYRATDTVPLHLIAAEALFDLSLACCASCLSGAAPTVWTDRWLSLLLHWLRWDDPNGWVMTNSDASFTLKVHPSDAGAKEIRFTVLSSGTSAARERGWPAGTSDWHPAMLRAEYYSMVGNVHDFVARLLPSDIAPDVALTLVAKALQSGAITCGRITLEWPDVASANAAFIRS